MNLDDLTEDEDAAQEAGAKGGSDDDECVIVTGPKQPVTMKATSSVRVKAETEGTTNDDEEEPKQNPQSSKVAKYSKAEEAAILKIDDFKDRDARSKYVATLVTRLHRKKSNILGKLERLKKSRT